MKISVNSALSSLVGVFLLSSVSIDYQTVHAAPLSAPATIANKIDLTPITESRIAAGKFIGVDVDPDLVGFQVR
ncbi:MAG: hypothetical protein H7237_02330, partial [Alkalinema sp. FL-bin-369]|nr:hypothetical protein [Leptolyngbyaceae cyanobacterium LF-bin-369]